jgi:hypothetical protein
MTGERAKRDCPICGSPGLAVVYGLPASQTLIDKAERGEVLLGGCTITGDDPTRGCRNGHTWGGRTVGTPQGGAPRRPVVVDVGAISDEDWPKARQEITDSVMAEVEKIKGTDRRAEADLTTPDGAEPQG